MTEQPTPVLIDIPKAAEILNKSTQAVRQFIQRGKLHKIMTPAGVRLDIQDVLTYYARKKNLPAWETHINAIKHKTFVSLDYASKELMRSPQYILTLVRRQVIEGYVTGAGDIMLCKTSVNNFLRKPENVASDL